MGVVTRTPAFRAGGYDLERDVHIFHALRRRLEARPPQSAIAPEQGKLRLAQGQA